MENSDAVGRILNFANRIYFSRVFTACWQVCTTDTIQLLKAWLKKIKINKNYMYILVANLVG